MINNITTNISTILETNEPRPVQGALTQEEHRALSFTAVLVLTCIFAFFTLSITGAIIVFCKKKNSVFALQKCEQESDIDYGLDDLNSTEIEMSDDGFDDDLTGPAKKRSATYPDLKIVCNRNYRPHSVRDVGKYEAEKQGGGTEIPRAHTFSFEKYEYTPIALSVPHIEGDNHNNNNRGEPRVKTKVKQGTRGVGYHQLRTSDKDSIESQATSIGEIEVEDDKQTEDLYLNTQINGNKIRNCDDTLGDSVNLDKAKLLQHPH